MALPDIESSLTPAQLAVLEALRVGPEGRPEFDAQIGRALRSELEGQLAPAITAMDAIGVDSLWVSKHKVASALGCERRFVAELDDRFDGWTVARARGTVTHRAIELSMHVRGAPVPADLVDHSLVALEQSDSKGLGDWLAGVSELERAELRAGAVDGVCAFLELWPPLDREWRPRTESTVKVRLFGERITLAGKVDLTVGYARGTSAGKVLIDLKTGGFSPTHRDDLRFYALLDTVAHKVPPRRVATHYLDSGDLVPEDVTDDLLHSALARVVDAVTVWLELRAERRDPVTKPGPSCRWCRVLDECSVGRQHLESVDDW